MTTQQTPDREQPDHESSTEAWAHTDSVAHANKTPRNKKNWDKRTRRRHSVSTSAFAAGENPEPAPDRTAESTQSGSVDAVQSEPAEVAPSEAAAQKQESTPKEGASHAEISQENLPREKALEEDPSLPAASRKDAPQETTFKGDVPQEEPRAPSLNERVSSFDDDFYDSLDISTESEQPEESQETRSPEQLEQPEAPDDIEQAEKGELTEEVEPAEEASESNKSTEPVVLGFKTVEIEMAEPAPLESKAVDPEASDSEVGGPKAIESAAIELETEASAAELEALVGGLADIARETEDAAPKPAIPTDARTRSWKAKRRMQEKRARYEESRRPQAMPDSQPVPPAPTTETNTPQPAPRPVPAATAQNPQSSKKSVKKQAQKPTKESSATGSIPRKQVPAETQPASGEQSSTESQPIPRNQRSPKQPAPAVEPRQAPHEQSKPERTSIPRKQRPRPKYLQSPTLKQAFRNLLKLNGGAAWRTACWPIVAFFVLFVLVSLAVVDAFPAVDTFNATINAAIHSLRGALDGPIIVLTTIGDFLPMAALCLVVCLILYLAKKWDSLAFFATNVVFAIICVQALKLIFAVPRPGDETLVPIPGSFSFPSAHSFCSLIVLGMIGLLIFRALYRRGFSRNAAMAPGIILVIFAILIGLSRIYVGVHWPSDVLGGWLLAGLWLSFAGPLYTVGARQK